MHNFFALEKYFQQTMKSTASNVFAVAGKKKKQFRTSRREKTEHNYRTSALPTAIFSPVLLVGLLLSFISVRGILWQNLFTLLTYA